MKMSTVWDIFNVTFHQFQATLHWLAHISLTLRGVHKIAATATTDREKEVRLRKKEY